MSSTALLMRMLPWHLAYYDNGRHYRNWDHGERQPEDRAATGSSPKASWG